VRLPHTASARKVSLVLKRNSGTASEFQRQYVSSIQHSEGPSTGSYAPPNRGAARWRLWSPARPGRSHACSPMARVPATSSRAGSWSTPRRGNEWRDIMSYKANCGGCPRLPVWSNPDVLIGGAPAGSVGHDNARVIADNVLRVAAFRERKHFSCTPDSCRNRCGAEGVRGVPGRDSTVPRQRHIPNPTRIPCAQFAH
jgi:hypothetical protein